MSNTIVMASDKIKVDINLLHQVQTDLALEVKRICEMHDIPYFLVDGTALGAYYLHDFLPWDDDLDIGMYWRDYQHFLNVCKRELPHHYIMKDITTDDLFGCSFGQLIDTSYIFIQENTVSTEDINGVYIDIHPFCDCSNIKLIRLAAYYQFKFYKLCLLQRRNYMNKSSCIERIFRFANKFISEDKLVNKILAIRNNDKWGGKYALKIHGRHAEDLIVKSNLRDLENCQFIHSDIFFPVQPDCKRMLDKVYGEFDENYNEYNRHRIIEMHKRDCVDI